MSEKIRLVSPEDSQEILSIYTPYILNTAITFETEAPTADEFAGRIAAIREQYPYLAYEADGRIVAYAYASRHRERAAYCYDADLSVYAASEYHGAGVAAKLYRCLIGLLREQGIVNVYAGCTVPNERSIRFHKKFGFKVVGTYRNTGYKLGRWHDVVWLEKHISEHGESPGPLLAAPRLPGEVIERILAEHS